MLVLLIQAVLMFVAIPVTASRTWPPWSSLLAAP